MKTSDPSPPTSRRRRQLGTGIAVLFGLLLGMLALAPSASAHHPEISGTVGCDYQVDWTASTWNPAGTDGMGEHPNVVVEYRLDGAGAWTQVPTGSPGAFASPENPSFSGSFVAPGTPTSVMLRSRTVGPWTIGEPGGQTTTTGVLTFPTDCAPPSTPAATALADCAEEPTITVSFVGVGSATTVDIRKDGVLIGDDVSVPVGPSSYVVPLEADDENSDVTITLDYAAATATDQTLVTKVDCGRSAPTIGEPVCQAEGGLDVTLGNVEGTDTATFTITVDGEETTVDVAAGLTQVVNIPAAEDTTVSVTITSGDASYSNPALERNCQEPAAEVTFDCAVGGVVVILTNSGSEAALVDVEGELVEVPAGTTADAPVTRTIPVEEDAPYSVTVLGETAEGTRDCEQPGVAAVAVECGEGGVVVSLTNGGTVATTVSVAGNDVVVPAGTTDEDPLPVLVPVAENAAYDFMVIGDDLELQVTGTYDCLLPAGAVDEDVECAAGGLDVTVRNPGDDTAEVTVTSPALPGGETTVSVPAGETVPVFIPLAEDTSTTVTVTAGEDVLFDETVTRDCETVLPGVVTPTAGTPGTSGTALPRTGSEPMGMVAMGALLLLAGTVLASGARLAVRTK